MTQENNFSLQATCVRLDVTAADWQEAIRETCRPLLETGYVKAGYPDDVIARESSGPLACPPCRWGWPSHMP